jgi:type IX secretion system PorP/SprF family membrane protein
MKAIIKISALLLIATSGYAQQDAQYNQYIFNSLIINPAYAGTKEVVNVNAIYSTQWTGFSGSPTTQTLSIDGPVNEKVGVGFHLINDNVGAESQQGLFGSYSYKVRVNDKMKLSMGLSVGASYFSLDGSKLSTTNPDDPAIPKTLVTKLKLDAKSGLFLYSDRFYAGLSVSDLLANVFKSTDLLVPLQTRHYYLTSGYVFDLGSKFKLKPSFLLKEDFKAPTNIDLSTFVLYNDRFWLGVTGRFGAKIFTNKDLQNSLKASDALVFMAEYNINDRFRVGYAYTYSTSVLRGYPGHEFSLGYYFPDKTDTKMKSIRYF